MPMLEERVDTLESVLANFIENTDRAIAEIRASNTRTDLVLLKAQQQADKAHQQADKDRLQMDKNRRLFELQSQHDREENRRVNNEFRAEVRQWRAEDIARLEQCRTEDRAEAKEFRAEDRARVDQFRAEDKTEAEERWNKVEKERKEFNKQMAGISDKMGKLIEDIVAPNIQRITAQICGESGPFQVSERVRRPHPTQQGRNMEVDLLVVGRSHVLLCEAKTTVTIEKIADFLERVRDFAGFFPEYAHCALIPVIASVSLESSLITHLSRQKVYGLAFADETMELVNFGQF